MNAASHKIHKESLLIRDAEDWKLWCSNWID